MSRLYDKIMAGDSNSPNGPIDARRSREALKTSTVVAVDDVADYFFGLAGKGPGDWNVFRDVPNAAPPFEHFFVECRRPAGPLGTRWEEHLEWLTAVRWGASFRATDMLSYYRDAGYPDPEGASHERGAEVYARLGVVPGTKKDAALVRRPHEGAPYARWLLDSELFLESRGWGKVLSGGFGMRGVVMSDGSFAPTLDGDGAVKFWTVPEGLSETASSKGAPAAKVAQASAMLMHTLYLPLLLAVSFMNCSNVRLVSEDPSERERKSFRKKRRRELCSYQVLRIEPMKEVLEREGGASRTGIRRAMHLCRGHFRHYTPERGGPFGRSIESPQTVWVPQHARGSRKHGEVKKDYAVKAPPRAPAAGTARALTASSSAASAPTPSRGEETSRGGVLGGLWRRVRGRDEGGNS